jgi:hypothetical protein
MALQGSSPQHDEIVKVVFVSFFLAFCYFLNITTAQTRQPIFNFYASNDLVWNNDALFGGLVDHNFRAEVNLPPENLDGNGKTCY